MPSKAASSAVAKTDSALRRWETIAGDLRDDIAQGRLKPGERLPNEATLAERFGVNRHTLRQSIQALARDGFVRVVHGSGTYVRELVLDYARQRRHRLSHNLAMAGDQAQQELVADELQRGGDWARELGLSGHAGVQMLYIRSSLRGHPVGLSSVAYPLPRLSGIVDAFTSTGSITRALKQLGVQGSSRLRSVASCRLPTEAEADALARSAAQPVLELRYVNVDTQGAPVEAGCTLFAADAVQLTFAAGSDLG